MKPIITTPEDREMHSLQSALDYMKQATDSLGNGDNQTFFNMMEAANGELDKAILAKAERLTN